MRGIELASSPGQTELVAWPADCESIAVHSGNTE